MSRDYFQLEHQGKLHKVGAREEGESVKPENLDMWGEQTDLLYP